MTVSYIVEYKNFNTIYSIVYSKKELHGNMQLFIKRQRLKGENQWQYKNHHDSHNNLQR